jgi:hypothetical protein
MSDRFLLDARVATAAYGLEVGRDIEAAVAPREPVVCDEVLAGSAVGAFGACGHGRRKRPPGAVLRKTPHGGISQRSPDATPAARDGTLDKARYVKSKRARKQRH